MKRTNFKKWMVTLVITLIYLNVEIQGMNDENVNKDEKKETQLKEKSSFPWCCCKNDASKNEDITLKKNPDLANEFEQYEIVNAKSIFTPAHVNFIEMNMKPYKYTILQYLTVREIILFGKTCNTLYNEIFKFEVKEGTRKFREFCTVDIPAHVIPHLKYLLQENPENLIGITLIHQIKQNKVFGYSSNGSGRMLTWQNHDAIDVETISSTYEPGNVLTWGNQNDGGDSTAIQHQLKNIKMIFSTRLSFAALTTDGNVVTWGDEDTGSDSSSVQHQLKNIKMIFSTSSAFAALTTDGNVVTWGRQSYGGKSTAVQHQLQNIKMIFSNDYAFAALK